MKKYNLLNKCDREYNNAIHIIRQSIANFQVFNRNSHENPTPCNITKAKFEVVGTFFMNRFPSLGIFVNKKIEI